MAYGEYVHQHSGYVQHVPSRGEHFGVCMTCNWMAPQNRKTEAEAQADVDAHVGSTGYPWNESTGRFDVPAGGF